MKEHISLTLSSTSVAQEQQQAAGRRLRFRRSWNRLSRCQRNLIVLGISVMCVTVVIFFPSNTMPAETTDENAVPLREHHQNIREESLDYAQDLSHHKSLLALKQKLSADTGRDILPSKELRMDDTAGNLENMQKNVIAPVLRTIQRTGGNGLLELNGNDLNLQTENKMDERTTLEAAIRNPELLPGTKDVTISQLLGRMQAHENDAHKQHFHGANNERQTAVVAAFQHAWNGYKKYAWGHDNLKPISQSAHDWFGLGLTIVDSLDTLYIMGLDEEFMEARDWINKFLNFNTSREVNLFEVTIRVLGGLLATYHLSGDNMFLKKSVELGNRLLPCFLSPSGIPYSDVNLASMNAHSPKWSPDSSTSEVTTIQLEFRDLSRAINIPIYEQVVASVSQKVHLLEKKHGLVPIFINANTGTFRNYATISLGARGDSYYEYLLKQWIQTGAKPDDYLISDYMQAIEGVLSQLKRSTPKNGHVYIGELINGNDFKPKMDHLTCYLPGTLLLGHTYGMPESHLLLAQQLLDTCYQTYMLQPTHLAPEISYFAVNANDEQDIYVKPNDAHNLLRPEFIESLYYFYVITGNRSYQDMGWNIFEAFEKYTKVSNGYTSIGNVKNVYNTRLRDMMESFWLGETLKYFYLLFSDNRNEIDLNKWVFNSEAHPLPIRKN